MIIIITILIFVDYNLFLKIKEYRVNYNYDVHTLSKELVFKWDNNRLKSYYDLKPNIIVIMNPDWLGHDANYYINNDGFNDINTYNTIKPNNSFRIVTIGDSFTFGMYVDTVNSWPKVLEKKLNKLRCNNKSYEVLNLGVPGYDLEYSVEHLIEKGLKYQPDIVIFFVNNWNFDKINELLLPYQDNYIKSGEPHFDLKKGYVAYGKAMKDFRQLYNDEYILNYQKEKLEYISLIIKTKLLFVSFSHLNSKYSKIIEDVSKKNDQIFFKKLASDVTRSSKFLLPDRHPNVNGHKIIAEDINNIIQELFIINCKIDKYSTR